MVQIEDVIDHLLSNLEEAARVDNAKACKTLVTDLVREILGQNRRLAVEKGVVSSIIGIIRQFYVRGPEKDQVQRVQLVGTCLDILVQLGAYVTLDADVVAFCVLLRAHGVRVVTDAMVAHWKLKNRTLALLNSSLRVLLNVAASDQGSRMLAEASVHAAMADMLEKDKIADKHTLLLIFRIMATMAVFNVQVRRDIEPRIEELLQRAAVVHKEDLALHGAINCLMCMVSTAPSGAKAILAYEGSLGYIVQVLHNSTTALLQLSQQSPTQATSFVSESFSSPSSELGLSEQELADRRLAEQLDAEERAQAAENANGEQDAASTPGEYSPPRQPRRRSFTGLGNGLLGGDSDISMDTINSTARNAVSAGSSLFNNLIRRQANAQNQASTVRANSNSPSPSGGGKSLKPASAALDTVPESKYEAARKLSCWTSMLLHNLCVSARHDVQIRMVISQAYQSGNAALGTRVDRPIFQRILRTMNSICDVQSTAPHAAKSPDAEADLLDFGTETVEDTDGLSSLTPSSAPATVVDRLVEHIVSGADSSMDDLLLAGHENEDDFTARAILLNVDFIYATVSKTVSLTSLLRALLQRFSELVANSGTSDVSISDPRVVLPLAPGASRVVAFVLLLVAHPKFRRRLEGSQLSLELLMGSPDADDAPSGMLISPGADGDEQEEDLLGKIPSSESFVGILRRLDLPEYAEYMDRCVNSLLNVSDRRLRVLPLLPYRSFHHEGGQGLLNTALMTRQSSTEPDAVPTATSVMSSPSVRPRRKSSADKAKELVGSTPASTLMSPRDILRRSKGSAASTSGPIDNSGASSDGGANGRLPRRQTMSGGQVISRSWESQIFLDSNRKQQRRLSSSYVPSHSNLILSPLLHAGSGSFQEEVEVDSPAAAARRKEVEVLLSEWHGHPAAVAVQISLRLERLYMATDPWNLVVLANVPGAARQDACVAEKRFLAEFDKLVYFFKTQVLRGDTPNFRAQIVECIIDIASVAAGPSLRNASLVMACLEALGSRPIRRLELTWRNVAGEKWQAFDDLKRITGVGELLTKPNASALDSPRPSVQSKRASKRAARAKPADAGAGDSGGRSKSANKDQVETSTLDPKPDGDDEEGDWLRADDEARAVPLGLDPTPFLGSARIPYLHGVIFSLQALEVAEEKVDDLVDIMPAVPTVSQGVTSTSGIAGALSGKSQVSGGGVLSSDAGIPIQVHPPARVTIHARSSSSGAAGLKASPSASEFDPLGIFSAPESASTEKGDPDGADAARGAISRKSDPALPFAGSSGLGFGLDEPFLMEEDQAQNAQVAKVAHVDLRTVEAQYEVLAKWITTVRKNGDWCQRMYTHEPDVALQIMLQSLASRPPKREESQLEEVSLRCEPPWSLDQMLLESLYAIEGWIESLFESETEEEGKVIRAFRARLRKKDQNGNSGSGGGVGSSLSERASSVAGALSPTNASSGPSGAAGSDAAGSGTGAGADGAGQASTAASRLRLLAENAGAQIIRSSGDIVNSLGRGGSASNDQQAGLGGSANGPPQRSYAQAASSTQSRAASRNQLPGVPAPATGKLINSLVKKISGARKERLFEESGSRSAEHWDKIVDHVRLCVERIVLAPVLSRLLLGALREHSAQECALQERVLILRSLPAERLGSLLGLPDRKGLGQASWGGAIATLKSFDDVDMPSLKLRILLRLKDEIYAESGRLGVADMNADEFLPVVTYVIVQAQLQHAYATTMLLRDLLNDDFVSGEAAYYLTTFEIALGHLLGMELPDDVIVPDILSKNLQQ